MSGTTTTAGDPSPRIVSADVVPGHDGLAEVLVSVEHANRAVRPISLPLDAVEAAFDGAGITSLADLVGRPWTVLAAALTTRTTSQGAP